MSVREVPSSCTRPRWHRVANHRDLRLEGIAASLVSSSVGTPQLWLVAL